MAHVIVERSPSRQDTYRVRHTENGVIQQGRTWRTVTGAVKAAKRAYPNCHTEIDHRYWERGTAGNWFKAR